MAENDLSVSVMLTTYNQPEFLEMSLLAYDRQTYKNFEIVIADDGSGSETRELIEKMKAAVSYPLTHAWQEDLGFRVARSFNNAIRASRNDYLITSSCDCLPRADFVEKHVEFAQEGYYVGGGHVRMSKEFTESLNPEMVKQGTYEKALNSTALKKIKKRHFKHRIYLVLKKKRRPKFLGLNFAVYKKAAFEINGFDENFQGWGQEDSDFRERLKKHGLKPRSILPQAVVFHMHHPTHPTAVQEFNRAYSRRKNLDARCINGLKKLN
jgi:glycosyltransferase involved in cell wall biosynthesis